MTESTKKFSGLATLYSKHRPGYPNTAIEFIIQQCNLDSSSKVVDVGCGTGISTRTFYKAGIKGIIGIEPNKDMLEKAQSDNTVNGGIQYVNSKAEETGLEPLLIDAVISAQAFHWFDPEKSLVEFHRILKLDGHCTLMWNVREETDPLTHGYGSVMYDHSTNASDEVKRGVSGKHLLLSPLFDSVAVKEFSNSQTLSKEGLLGRALSTSYAPRDQAGKESLTECLEKLFDQHEENGSVTLKYLTCVYISKKA